MFQIIVLAVTVLYFIFGSTGRASGKLRRTVFVLLSVIPFIPMLIRFAGAVDLSGLNDVLSFDEIMGMEHIRAPEIGSTLLAGTVSLVNAVFCIVGFIRSKDENERDTVLADQAAVLSGISAAAFALSMVLLFSGVLVVPGSMLYKTLLFILCALAVGILTFGIGLILMAVYAVFFFPEAVAATLIAGGPLFAL